MEWAQLNDEQRDKLLEKYRDVSVDHEWWGGMYDDLKETMLKRGFAVSDIQFSGFWCQGDGASFCGYVCDWKQFAEHYYKDQYPMLHKLLGDGYDYGHTIKLVRDRGMYCHEYMVSAELDIGSFSDLHNDYEGDEFMDAAYAVWNVALSMEVQEFEKDFQRTMRDEMRVLYCDLEKEYEYLTSDECVSEWVENNINIAEELEDLELID